jgi:hypothetical protein
MGYGLENPLMADCNEVLESFVAVLFICVYAAMGEK